MVLHGWDPMWLLATSGVDYMVVRAILEEAEKLDARRKREEIKAIEVAMHNAMAKVFSKLFRG